MKYCYRFSNKLQNIDEADEIKIIYEGQVNALIDFISRHQATQITLVIKNYEKFLRENEIAPLRDILSENNIKLCFDELRRATSLPRDIVDTLPDLFPIQFYFNHTIASWEMLHYYLNLGASEVYISEQLGFELPAVRALCSRYGVNIRAFPNVAQCESNFTDPLQRFFIRPEDLELYSQYIDIFEFWGPDDRQAIFRRIYERKKWGGDLSEIISSLDCRLDSPRLVSDWGGARVNCKRACLAGKSCHICQRIANISHKLEKENLFIRQRKSFDFS